jgi:hypothetical protein
LVAWFFIARFSCSPSVARSPEFEQTNSTRLQRVLKPQLAGDIHVPNLRIPISSGSGSGSCHLLHRFRIVPWRKKISEPRVAAQRYLFEKSEFGGERNGLESN